MLHAAQCLLESRAIEWLKEVIECANLECPNCVIVKGCDEYDDRKRSIARRLESLKAVEIRHLHIEEEHVELVLPQSSRCLRTVAAFDDDLVSRPAVEKRSYSLARERLVIGNANAHRIHATLVRAVSVR